MSNYIPLFYVDVLTYPFTDPDAGLATLDRYRGYPAKRALSAMRKHGR